MANYHDIAADLRSKINHGYYEKEKKLPKQAELATLYHTSRVTIQKALNILQLEGIIYGKKGTGTFINDSYSTFDYNAKINRGLTRRLGETGKISSKIISFAIIYPDEKEQEQLKIKSNQKIYDIVRLRLFNDIPFVLEYTIMPLHVIPGVTEEVLTSSVYGYITNQLHSTIGTSVRRIKADRADKYDQKYLACSAADPILEVEQTVYLGDGTPFEFSQSRHRYDMGDFIVVNN
ncbi:hypothetical protein A5844_000975 [Enterococcus sp. 10A9_DIV0425]|uniref:HTH gntR-type domain-containing protein n=1 Tax=Candidatus Enterococcus wittei TaxID=1987383 RepID=A0A242JZK6_9ENTE|nr:GntR family transcriptional regulator [Enterococcus sp. 10A9_DIV0425]OTP10841.1 hypothetical protein A5844_000975 [Enterococcus sp. 10A9_DIV0425]THE14905.1 GntR family transcriptional regulator [Enterococcus hirae]